MAKSDFEQLIDLHSEDDGSAEASDRRRKLLRSITDKFMVAADRYGHRDMEMFDLLLSSTARTMDQNIRKLMAMTLVRVGAREEHVRLVLNNTPSPNALFLRRSVVQMRQDLLATLQERVSNREIEGDETLSDGNSLTLPAFFLNHLYTYIYEAYQENVSAKIGAERAKVVARTMERASHSITETAMRSARDEVVSARKTVREWVRRHAIDDELLSELLEARAMTEFVFALSAMFDLDIASTIRVLNDSSFESLAIAAKSQDIRRATFAKIIQGFRQRNGDCEHIERILGLYDKLPVETAERVMRFWRLRTADLGGSSAPSEFHPKTNSPLSLVG